MAQIVPSLVGTKMSNMSKDMNKKFVIPILLALAIALISAREFWMQPLKFVYKSRGKTRDEF